MFASKNRFLTNAIAGGGYAINNSLRFRASASAGLSRTFTSSTNPTLFTYSFWWKRGILGAQTVLFGENASTQNGLVTQTADNISWYVNNAIVWTTTAVFRDPSAWYHLVLVINGTAITLYSNGVQVATGTATNTRINTAILHSIGRNSSGSVPTDGYMTEIYLIDGQALTPSSFGAIDANGVWSPTAYSGSYGNNGFYLKFADNSGATATTIGKDSSGNGNNWTPNNISVTAGTTYDSMIDSPTNAASATQPVGNYAVLNPLDVSTQTLSNANLKIAGANAWAHRRSSIQMTTGKWYWEDTVSFSTYVFTGVVKPDASLTQYVGQNANGWGFYTSSGAIRNNGSDTSYGSSVSTGTVLGFAFDAATGKLWVRNASGYYNSGDPAAGTNAGVTIGSGTFYAAGSGYETNAINEFNFGQQPFTYTPPSGYQALCTANLATPTIKNGAQYMAATTYTGTGATLSITNTVNSTSFKPDWVWTKSRSASTDNKITDSVRGVTNALVTNSTAAQTTDAGGVTAFNSNGFTLGTTAAYNTNTATYVGWQWLCNAGTTSSNTNGSITSTVQVNATAGFSILTYTGTGANATVGHGLGVTPSMIIVKAYSGATGPFSVWHTKLPIPTTQRFGLNNATTISASATYWNSTLPTSSVFSIGTSTDVNTSTASYLAYCFAAITGYSAFGSYVGNASTDGPFVYCGFRPRCILIRLTDTTTGENSYLFDTSRNTYNTVQNALEPSQNSSESVIGVVDYIDILSNGFKCRSATLVNASGLTYVYAAFAENPFNYSRAR